MARCSSSTVSSTAHEQARKNLAGLNHKHRQINELRYSGGGTRTPDTRIMIMPSRADSSVLIRTNREKARRYRIAAAHTFPDESH